MNPGFGNNSLQAANIFSPSRYEKLNFAFYPFSVNNVTSKLGDAMKLYNTKMQYLETDG